MIDGDTIDVGDTRIRLHGIDAPEREQTCTTKTGQAWGCGDWATRQVRDHFEGLPARCEALDTDRYGRTVARCTVAGHDMGRVLVQAGFALAYRKYSLDYDLDEKAALVSQRGVHGFDMQAPARYREVRRAEMVSRDRQSGLKKKIRRRPFKVRPAGSRATSAGMASASTTCRVNSIIRAPGSIA
ncbi:thermonuclease family protein [Sulfitobacter aestuariivivens]|uniref:thermonuclease family protein n=1 Tax=Sulfitobacter aestuariivivens TaxID=2766981 RepID=UPI00361A12A3